MVGKWVKPLGIQRKTNLENWLFLLLFQTLFRDHEKVGKINTSISQTLLVVNYVLKVS